MFNAYGMARLGRDVEVGSTPDGTRVAKLSLAFTVFVKREKVTQWVEASWWGGTRIASLEEYLTKGSRIVVSLDNLHEDKFNKADGTPSSKLVARVADIDLAGSPTESSAPTPPPRPAARQAPPPANTRAPASKPAHGFDDMDDDIPF